MALINEIIARIPQDEEGQGLAEYALILALIAIVAIIALIFLGGQVSGILSTVGKSDLARRHSRHHPRPPARPAAFVRPARIFRCGTAPVGSQDGHIGG